MAYTALLTGNNLYR